MNNLFKYSLALIALFLGAQTYINAVPEKEKTLALINLVLDAEDELAIKLYNNLAEQSTKEGVSTTKAAAIALLMDKLDRLMGWTPSLIAPCKFPPRDPEARQLWEIISKIPKENIKRIDGVRKLS